MGPVTSASAFYTHIYSLAQEHHHQRFDSDNSNVVQLFSILKKDDRDQQMVYYQAGIGTYTSPQIATPGMAKLAKVCDRPSSRYSISSDVSIKRRWIWQLDDEMPITGAGGYEFLMQNCSPIQTKSAIESAYLVSLGERILQEGNHQQVPFAYKMFTRDDEVGYAQSAAFKRAFSVDATIEFVGVWDTVNSVGVFPKRLPFTTSNTVVKTFRHAISLAKRPCTDERRAKFKANLWNPPADHHKRDRALEPTAKNGKTRRHHHHLSRQELEEQYWKDPNQKTDIEEVWFAGCHCDIGGGSVSNEDTTNLARIPLRWMIRECFKTNTGILFHSEGIRSLGLDPDCLWPEVRPRPPALPGHSSPIQPIPRKSKAATLTSPAENAHVFKTEEELDLEDVCSPIYDQLSLARPWWILEFLPTKNKYRNGESLLTELRINLGRARKIPGKKQGLKVHRSVKTRMEAQGEKGKKYVPKAKFSLERDIFSSPTTRTTAMTTTSLPEMTKTAGSSNDETTQQGLQTPPDSSPELLLSVDPTDNHPTPFYRQRPPRESHGSSSRFPTTIPPDHEHRTLILCFDGTGDQFDADNSNIVQLCSLLKKEDRKKQMVYYQPLTIHYRGAYTARSLAGMLYKVGLLGCDNFQQVPFAYRMYSRVDEIGWEQSTAFKQAFSREVTIDFLGVWDTVESVGLISKRLPFTTTNNIVRTFRHALSLDERRAKFKPYLWDPKDHSRETPASKPPIRSSAASVSSGSSGYARRWSKSPNRHFSPLRPSLEWPSNDDRRISEYEEKFSSHNHSSASVNQTPTDVKEVWFAGCHCDVGGGSVKNNTRHSLARVSLRWMIRECFKVETGIMFDSQRLQSIGLDPSTLYPYVAKRPPRIPCSDRNNLIKSHPEKLWHRISTIIQRRRSAKSAPDTSAVNNKPFGTSAEHQIASADRFSEEEEEFHDAMAAKYDQLKIVPWWWILEVIPMQFRYQKKRDEWVSCFKSNMADPRVIPGQNDGFYVHRSVKTRMEAATMRANGERREYLPKALFEVKPSWED
ncbi:hypothetical protein D9757_002578 [Collybiopsis confluens]|uniref:T6SS Phospholipase effector Tle1-like catalytic domain-containing protein n=1 Tax=Collybiopsis confluens TaxID=2823264 RepID=A0A8H5HW82_9AGAR|nr:hypothetical protein D9757_002578 [Collybiopsis confluens]